MFLLQIIVFILSSPIEQIGNAFISLVGNGVTMFPSNISTLNSRSNSSCESFDNGEHYLKIE